MKAIVYHEYGSAEVLNYEEVDKPSPKDNEVLIKVRAAAINPLDWRLMHGQPKVIRLMARAMKMGGGRPGVDVAGEIEVAGPDVKTFKSGDQVFGGCRGALAEYACTVEKSLVMKPADLTFEQAASIQVAGLTALQGLRDKGKIQSGQSVLINGASGGVGTFAVQIAKTFGAQVTGVCSTRNLELVKSIGADAVIDYTKADFTSLPEKYDVILECVGNKTLAGCRRVLNRNGRCVVVGAPHDMKLLSLLALNIKGLGISLFSKQKATFFVSKSSPGDLSWLAEMIANGKIKPVIDSQYPLDEAAEAMRRLERGHARGKVVIVVSSDSQIANAA